MPQALVASILALLVTSCASTPPARPRAAIRPSTEATYPPSRFITGIGHGSTVELARQRAFTAIAEQIQGRLWAEGAVSAEEVRGSSGDKRVNSDRESIREEIRVEAWLPRTEWVRVVSHTEADGQHEVHAVLDKDDATRILRDEIDRAVASLAAGVDEAMAAPGLLARSLAVDALQPKRAELVASLVLLGRLSRQPIPDPPVLVALDRLVASLRAAWAAVRWEVCLGGEQAAQREGALAARLAGAGLDAHTCGKRSAPDPEEEGERALELAGTSEPTEEPRLLPTSAPRWRLVGRLDVKTQQLRQPGAYPVFCSTHLEFRVVDETEGVQGGGAANGQRAGGMGPAAACAASLGSLIDELLAGLGHPAGTKPKRR